MSAPVSSLPALTGTQDVTSTASGMAAEAARILAEINATPWPDTREARGVIEWHRDELADLLDMYRRLLKGEMEPYDVRAPDMGLWWDEERALEYVADQALEAAKSARKRLAEYQRRERSSEGDEGR